MPSARQMFAAAALVTVMTSSATAQDATSASRDSGFAELQERGRQAMGVDQYTSAHRFDDLEDGGRIELQRDSTDSAGVRTIREHLQDIAEAFAAGNFETPGFVHATEVPGTAVMRARRSAIEYAFRPLPGGGEVRITSLDPVAVNAIHQFLAFQRQDHRSPGVSHQH